MINKVAVAMLLSCVVLGCQNEKKQSAAGTPATTRALPRLYFTDADNGKTVHVPERNTFNVSLQSQPSTGFGWEMKPAKRTLFVHNTLEGGGRMGAVQNTVFKLVGTGVGEDDIAFAYGIPSSSKTRVPNVARYFKMHVVYDPPDPYPAPGGEGLVRFVVHLDPRAVTKDEVPEVTVKRLVRDALVGAKLGEVAGDAEALPLKLNDAGDNPALPFGLWVVTSHPPYAAKALLGVKEILGVVQENLQP